MDVSTILKSKIALKPMNEASQRKINRGEIDGNRKSLQIFMVNTHKRNVAVKS